MATDPEHIMVRGGSAKQFRVLKDRLEKRWGFEPQNSDVLAMLLANWQGFDEIPDDYEDEQRKLSRNHGKETDAED